MKQISKISDLKAEISRLKSEGKKIGFVPTMGALHSGHISLLERSLTENNITVVSIFVNPTQFNDKNDLKNYPRTPEHDYKMLRNAGCDIIFTPEVEEMYPKPDTREFDFGSMATVMEGRFRPGHFNGVAQIVSKLFDIVNPNKAYFGEKDFQQVAIIRKMVDMLKINVKIISCPIVREESGLAKSSRNELLTPEERKKAALISKTLFESANFVPGKDIETLKKQVVECINEEPVLKVEYFEIVDGYTLQPLNDWKDADYIVGCIAVYCGKVRLIDNITYKQ
jgi:pantoate--beta-alanine ligase